MCRYHHIPFFDLYFYFSGLGQIVGQVLEAGLRYQGKDPRLPTQAKKLELMG